MPSNFTYQARNEAQVEKRSNQSASKYAGVIKDDFNTFAARKDDNTIRLLPPTWENPDHYGYDIWVHFGVGPDSGTVLCLSKMKRQACPICEFQQKAESAGREDADDYKPKRRVLVWLVDRKTEAEKKSTEENPKVWTMPWTVDRDISKICKDRESGALYMIDHPEAGYDVFFDKSGEKELTKYSGFALSRRESSVAQAYIDFIVQNPLPSVLLWREYAEVKFLFEGEAVDVKQAEVVPIETAPTHRPALVQHTVTPVPAPIPQPPMAIPAPPPLPPPPPPAPLLKAFPPTGWTAHPSAPGYFYMGSEVLSEVDLRARNIPQAPPAPPAPPLPPPIPTTVPDAASRAAAAASALKSRFQTGAK